MSRFTPANAREMAARSQAKRKEAKLAPPVIPLIIPQTTDEEASYMNRRISSAREQIEKLTAKALKEADPQNLERLARAVAQWSEIERIMSGRPLPGSHRPTNTKRHDPEPDLRPL